MTFSVMQGMPQPPQFCTSLVTSLHAPAQHVVPPAHALPQAPQWSRAVITSTHLLAQHSPPPMPMQSSFTLHPSVQRRSEEHTSELQSQSNLVCRLLLEK